ncbi:hypothetical protein PMIN01_12783 [Paraphaeosphaeria minitans]|uniref:Uncharacterized protein n=1 Tax=Paraphaeosphaeria minitans TaxID=565426 RepID=A0A9P6G5I5_9PLEO|nr:hypothetical protein PMIN01_12783 [Paraphaeosphaeria minitans]
MAPFWESIGSTFGRAIGFGVSGSEDDHLPPTASGKRKASEPRRSSQSYQARRYPLPKPYRRAPGAYTTLAHEKGEAGPRLSEQRQERLSHIPEGEEEEESPSVTGFTEHKNSLDRRPPKRMRRRPSIPTRRRSSMRSPQGAKGDDASGVAGAAKTVSFELTDAGSIGATVPAATEANLQARLLAEYPDEDIEVRYLAQFQEDDYDDVQLSDGELGRRYFGLAPWAKNRTEWDDMMKDGRRIESRPGKTVVARTPTSTVPKSSAPEATAVEFTSDGGQSSSEVEAVALEEPGESPVKVVGRPAVRPDVKRDIKLPVKAPVKPADRPVVPAIKPVAKSAVNSPRKPVHRPVHIPAIAGFSQAKPVTLKKPPIATVAHNVVKPVAEPVIEPPDYIKEWTDAPYDRLRTICEDYPTSYLAQVQKELQEPMYAIRDVEVRDMMWQLQDGIEEVAALFQATIQPLLNTEMSKNLTRIYADQTLPTSRVLRGVAGKDWTDEEGWHDIFASDRKRRALVCGIIGNVLTEQVFKHPFFGGDVRNIDALFDLQRDLRAEDAFHRKHESAKLLSSLTIEKTPNNAPNDPKTILHPPENFTTHVDVVVNALDTHLRPLLRNLCGYRPVSRIGATAVHWSLVQALTRLVGTAGLLALQMAVDPFTVYHHVPVANGDRFSHALHEAVNRADMERTHPRSSETVFPSEEVWRRARYDEAVVGMVLMDGLTAYRAGGWEAAGSDPGWDGDGFVGRVYAKDGDGGRGYRGRVLTHGWVFCEWQGARRVA